jgi:hypothetical protein
VLKLLIGFEVLTAFSMLVVLVYIRPGVKNERYSTKHGIDAIQRQMRRVADDAESEFWQGHRWAKWVLDGGRGLILWAMFRYSHHLHPESVESGVDRFHSHMGRNRYPTDRYTLV